MSARIERVGSLLLAATALYLAVLRPWHMTWGATGAESEGPVPGDELMPDADIVSTRAVEIDAPPWAVWPWLVQMGPGRGGAYTYDWIERRLGIDIHNVDPSCRGSGWAMRSRCRATRCASSASTGSGRW